MTKSELVRDLQHKMPHLTLADVEVVVNQIFDSMTGALAKGDRIEIRGFGSFTLRERRARQGRNPKTGESIKVPAKRIPKFSAGNELRHRVNHQYLAEQIKHQLVDPALSVQKD